MTAVNELELAAQQADSLQETVSRAYSGNAVVRWFDEVEPPESADRGPGRSFPTSPPAKIKRR